jgi:hypothetical protein
MNIMFEDSITDDVKSKYILLELDTFYFSEVDQNKTAYCLVESAPIQELINIEKHLELHNNLVKNYKLRNWKYCLDALEHLKGKWNRDLDSFYSDMFDRIKQNENQDLDSEWNGVIVRG